MTDRQSIAQSCTDRQRFRGRTGADGTAVEWSGCGRLLTATRDCVCGRIKCRPLRRIRRRRQRGSVETTAHGRWEI